MVVNHQVVMMVVMVVMVVMEVMVITMMVRLRLGTVDLN